MGAISHLAAPIRIDREKSLKCIHALRKPLGIIQSVHSDHHGASGQTVEHVVNEGRARRASCEPIEHVGLDPDRKYSNTHCPLVGLKGICASLLQVALAFEIAREVGRVALGLKADQVICGQLRDKPFVVGQGREDLRRGKRDVQEKSDSISMAAVAKHLGERNEMIIVHPDNIVGAQPISDLISKMHADASITAQIAAGKFCNVEAVMEDRP